MQQQIKITQKHIDALMESLESILGKSDRQHKEDYYTLDDRGYPILDTDGNKTYEPPVYRFAWDKHDKTFLLTIYEDAIDIVVHCGNEDKEILMIEDCNVAKLLLTASDFLFDKVEGAKDEMAGNA